MIPNFDEVKRFATSMGHEVEAPWEELSDEDERIAYEEFLIDMENQSNELEHVITELLQSSDLEKEIKEVAIRKLMQEFVRVHAIATHAGNYFKIQEVLY